MVCRLRLGQSSDYIALETQRVKFHARAGFEVTLSAAPALVGQLCARRGVLRVSWTVRAPLGTTSGPILLE